MADLINLDAIPLVQAKWYTAGRTAGVTMIVIHSMESGESSTTAEACAQFFTDPRDINGKPVRASAHYNCDNDSTVGSVRPTDTAWHTGQGTTNACSIGIEQAGRASQTDDQWNDDFSRMMIYGQVAPLVAALSARFNIPLTVLNANDLRAGNFRGVTTHAAITEAFGISGGHTDPGPNYPMGKMIAIADAILHSTTPSPKASHDMIDTLTLPATHPTHAGCGVEFRVFLGTIVHRWQDQPGGIWRSYEPITSAAPPFSLTSVSCRCNLDGAMEIIGWDAEGHVVRAWQGGPGQAWHAWATA